MPIVGGVPHNILHTRKYYFYPLNSRALRRTFGTAWDIAEKQTASLKATQRLTRQCCQNLKSTPSFLCLIFNLAEKRLKLLLHRPQVSALIDWNNEATIFGQNFSYRDWIGLHVISLIETATIPERMTAHFAKAGASQRLD
jgi:hypothetical protein